MIGIYSLLRIDPVPTSPVTMLLMSRYNKDKNLVRTSVGACILWASSRVGRKK